MFVAADYIGPSLPAFRKCTEGSVLVCTYTKRHRSLAVGRYDLRMVVAAMECTLTECLLPLFYPAKNKKSVPPVPLFELMR